MTIVPTLWPESTVICIGSGPSLTDADVEACRGLRVIAVNDNYRKAPWADVLYAADKDWWLEHQGAPSFAGLKYSLADGSISKRYPWPSDVQLLRNTGPHGLERDPSGLRTGSNSGYQAINLAVHLGARRILLLGYDMQRGPEGQTHWFGHHQGDLRRHSPYVEFLKAFPTLIKPLDALGIDVINCSRRTALDVFPKMPIEAAVRAAVAA